VTAKAWHPAFCTPPEWNSHLTAPGAAAFFLREPLHPPNNNMSIEPSSTHNAAPWSAARCPRHLPSDSAVLPTASVLSPAPKRAHTTSVLRQCGGLKKTCLYRSPAPRKGVGFSETSAQLAGQLWARDEVHNYLHTHATAQAGCLARSCIGLLGPTAASSFLGCWIELWAWCARIRPSL
jgi:hypothetical protein